MTTWKRVKKLFKIILRKTSNPDIKLVTPKKWDKLFPDFKLDCYGRCSIRHHIITCRYKNVHSKFQINDTLAHEVMHILFPSKPHWWIECAALKFMGYYTRGYHTRHAGRAMSDMPDIRKLKRLIKLAAKRNS